MSIGYHFLFVSGNLLVIAFVSYFGAKLHRPRLIGAGCLIMAMGSFITAAPHFFQGLYVYLVNYSLNPFSYHICENKWNSSVSDSIIRQKICSCIFHRYKYETAISHFSASNGTENILPCLSNGSLAQDEIPTVEIEAGMLFNPDPETDFR